MNYLGRMIIASMVICSGVLSVQSLVHADTVESPEEKGLRIVTEWKRRDSGWQDYTADVTMVLKNKYGQSSTRLFQYLTKEVSDGDVRLDGDKVMVIFESPKAVEGTALLTHAHLDREDDQWLYLPFRKRVKRLSSHDKTGSFVGSELAYEDIAFQEIQKYTYKWIAEEEYEGILCDVIDRFPVDKDNTGYLYQRVWYDKEEVRIQKIDFYDRKNSLLKTQAFSKYQLYNEKTWRNGLEILVNHQTGKSTELTWTNYEFVKGLTDNQFRQEALERMQ